MSIKPAKSEDIPSLVRLVNSAYRGEDGQVGWTNEAHLIGGPRTSETDVAELLAEQGSRVLICRTREDELAGCVYLKVEGDRLYLGMLSVWPALQGAGVGKKLMAAAMDYARERRCAAIRITVISVREELIAWYERQGFWRTGEMEPFHVGDRFGTVKRPLELAVLEKAL